MRRMGKDFDMPYTPPLRDPKAPSVRINLLSDTQTRRRRECARRWHRPRSATSRSATIRPPIACASASPTCSASRPRCSCRRAHVQHLGDAGALPARRRNPRHETAHIIAREGGAHAASAASRSRSFPARTENSRPIRFAPPCIRAPATSRRRPWSASNRPPISAAVRSGTRPTSDAIANAAKATASSPTWTARGC